MTIRNLQYRLVPDPLSRVIQGTIWGTVIFTLICCTHMFHYLYYDPHLYIEEHEGKNGSTKPVAQNGATEQSGMLLGWVPMLSTELSEQCHLCKWHWFTWTSAPLKISKVCQISNFSEQHLHKWHMPALSQVVPRTDQMTSITKPILNGYVFFYVPPPAWNDCIIKILKATITPWLFVGFSRLSVKWLLLI